MSTLRFTKMHGLGNDFVVINAIEQAFEPSPELIRKIGDRNFGVGFDQMLIVCAAQTDNHDFRYVIYNNDGSEVENCGNGVRCFARYVIEEGLIDSNVIRVETCAGSMTVELADDGQVRVDMGLPRFSPADLPFTAENEQLTYPLIVGEQTLEIAVASMGNPHAVVVVDNVDTADVETLGPLIESHERFPRNVNAGFLQVVDAHHGRLRVYERGVGETRACGTGACAAAVSGIRLGLLQSPVTLSLLGGDLLLEWAEGESVIMTGPATRVFDGTLDLNNL